MKKIISTIVIVTAGLLAATTQAELLELTTRNASGGDANLNENIPDAVNDNATLTVRSRLVSGTERHSAAAFRFGVASLGAAVTNATLKFDVTTSDSDSFAIDVYGLVDGTTKGSFTDANWAEAGVAYNTMPGFSTADYPNIDRDHTPGETVLLGTMNYVGGTLGEISLASMPALLDFINADANGVVTLFLETQVATTAGQDYFINLRSNKNSISGAEFYPTLTVETIPEPATLGLIGFISAGLLCIRRHMAM